MKDVVIKTDMPDVGTPRRGKVRDIYDLGEHLLLVVTDRVSPLMLYYLTASPEKGRY